MHMPKKDNNQYAWLDLARAGNMRGGHHFSTTIFLSASLLEPEMMKAQQTLLFGIAWQMVMMYIHVYRYIYIYMYI